MDHGNTLPSIPSKPTPPVPVLVASRVEDDKSPKLSGDLDARGHRIEDASVISTKELIVESTPFRQWIDMIAKSIKDWAFVQFAPKNHSHTQQFEDLEGKIMLEVNKKQQKGNFAEKDHTHPKEVQTLSMVERGNEIQELLNHVSDLCPKHHTHPDILESIKKLDADLKTLIGLSEHHASAKGLENLFNVVRELTASIEQDIMNVKLSIPKIVKEDIELIASRFCLIPRKCHLKKIVEISAVSFDGRVVSEFEIKRKTEVITVGSTVAVDDLLTLPQNVLVRIRFQ